MTELDKKKCRYMKAELENFYFVMRIASSKLLKIDSIEAQHSCVHDETVSVCPIRAEINQLNRELDLLVLRTEKVDRFIKKLSDKEQKIIYDLHMSPNMQYTYDTYCFGVGMSRATLHRYVNSLILKNWET